MRTILAAVAAFILTAAAGNAQAERRMFIIANNSDGYGIDQCLASGEKCGAAAAAAYCHAQQFKTAASYRKVERDDITGAIPESDGKACRGGACDKFLAIECTR